MFYSVRHRAINLSLLERLRSVTIFQKNLAKLMSEQGLNQVELAERSGVNQPHVAKLLSGRRVPSLKTLEKLAATLAQNNVPLPTIQALLGHETPEMTMRVYIHYYPKHLEDATEKLDY